MTADTSYNWSTHPAREQPWITVIVLVSLGVCSKSVAIWGGHWAWGLFAVAVFAWTLQQFWWPTAYTIDEDGLHIRMGLAESNAAWSEIGSMTVDERGGLVRLRRVGGRYWGSRELPLRFDDNRGEVVRIVRQYAPEIIIEDRQRTPEHSEISSEIGEGTIA